MTGIDHSVRRMRGNKHSIDYLSFSLEDYESLHNLKKIELEKKGIVDPIICNAAYRNLRIDIYKSNQRRRDCLYTVIDRATYIEYIEAREAVDIIRRELSQEEWFYLVTWFMGNKPDNVSKAYFHRKVKMVKEKCKTILGGI